MKYRIEITGEVPLLMHADTLTDPLSEAAKEMKKVSGKRTKTDEDHETMSWLEFQAGLYTSPTGEVALPSTNIMKSFVEGGRITKSGAKIERGVTLLGVHFPVQYDGPRSAASLFKDKQFVDRRSVKVGAARVMRTRPIFRQWALTVEAFADPKVCSGEDLSDIVDDAGHLVGLGDHRKIGGYGRFKAKVTPI